MQLALCLLLTSMGTLSAQLVRPVITLQPESRTAAVGADTTFVVSASGSLPMNFSWRLNGKVYTNILLDSGTCHFTLQDVSTNQAGSWRVGITNLAGAAIGLSSNAQLTVVPAPLVGDGFALVTEECTPPNHAIDPFEHVTTEFTLRNIDGLEVTNILAVLLEDDGVVSPSAPQNYLGLLRNGASVTRSFSFAADGRCGGTNVATLRCYDGDRDLGRVRFPFRLGVVTGAVASCCGIGQSDLQLSGAASRETAAVGTNISYALMLTNRGPDDAPYVRLSTEPLPEGVVFVSSQSSRASCRPSGASIECEFGTLARHDFAEVTVTLVSTLAGGVIQPAFRVVSDRPDFNLADNRVSFGTRIDLPSLTLSDAYVSEGERDVASTDAIFHLKLSLPGRETASVHFVTSGGTATAGIDYVSTNGILLIPPRTTNLTIAIPVLSDSVSEPRELFFLDLDEPSGVTLAQSRARGIILDRSILSESVSSLWSNSTPLRAHLSFFSDYDPAFPPTTLEPWPSSLQVSGLPNQLGKVRVWLHGVTSAAARHLRVRLEGPQGDSVLLMAGAGARAEAVTLSFDESASVWLPETNDLFSGEFMPTAYGSNVVTQSRYPLSVFKGSDPNGRWRLFADSDELYDSSTIESGWSLEIVSPLSASIADALVVEGNVGPTALEFRVGLTGPSSEPLLLHYATADGTAIAGEDYVAAAGDLLFPPGTTQQVVRVTVLGDTRPEPNEDFVVNLSGPDGFALGKWQATGRILNNDNLPANDHFTNAVVLSGASASGTGLNILASREPDEPVHAGSSAEHSLWWTWTAPGDGLLKLSSRGSSFASALGVYVGSTLSTLTRVTDSKGDAGAPLDQLTFNAVSNVTYRIAVDGLDHAFGEASLRLEFTLEQFRFSDRRRSDFLRADGPIYAIVETNGVVYVGGKFTHLIGRLGTDLAVNLDTREIDRDFPQVDGLVLAAVADGSDGFYLGGQFDRVGGEAYMNLVHIRSDHTLDTAWRPPALDVISEIVVANGQVYVVEAERRVLGLDPQTGTWTGWSWPPQPSTNLGIYTLALSEETLLVGGFEEGERPFVRGLDLVTASETLRCDFGPDAHGYISTLAASCDAIFAAGPWSGRVLAKFDLAGRLQPWSVVLSQDARNPQRPFNPYSVTDRLGVRGLALAVDGNVLYVGGSFGWINDIPRNGLAALDAGSGRVTDWFPDLDYGSTLPSEGVIHALAVADHQVFVSGDFLRIGGEYRRTYAALDPVSGRAVGQDLGTLTPVGRATVLAVSARTVFLGIIPSYTGASPHRNVAALDAASGAPKNWAAGVGGDGPNDLTSPLTRAAAVYALDATDSTVLVGGNFDSIWSYGSTFGYTSGLVGGFDAVSGVPTLQSSLWYGSSSFYSVAHSATRIFVGGFLNRDAYDFPSSRIGPPQTLVRAEWISRGSSGTYRLIVANDTVYAGGDDGVVGLEAATGRVVMDWRRLGAGTARGLALSQDGQVLYAGGELTSIAPDPSGWLRPGKTYASLAALETRSGERLPWTARLEGGSPLALAVAGDRLYVAGYPATFGGQARQGLAEVDATTGALTSWNPGHTPGTVGTSLFASKRQLYAGLTKLISVRGNMLAQHDFVVFPPEGAPVIREQPRDLDVLPGRPIEMRVEAVGQPWLAQYYQWHRYGAALPGATNAILAIPRAQPSDEGDYHVVVSNALGQISSQVARLRLSVPPRITRQPTAQNLSPGSPMSLRVEATGSQPLRYQWRLNGVNIPGAFGPTYTNEVTTPTNGGSYSVIVANSGGAISSVAVPVVISSPTLPFANNFAAAGALTGLTGVGSGSNAGATRELGEPNHVDKFGGASVWLSYTPPLSGIATLHTRGSGFDTLLAIYTGTNVAALTLVTADEDRGGYLTSRAAFNAVAGTTYWIAVDGFAGATGNIVLSWQLDPTIVEFPRILAQPLGQAVFLGQTALFEVAVSSPTSVVYQWFKGCRPIPGATNAVLTISSVQRVDVGEYHVVIMNASTRAAESFNASLEIGIQPKVISRDKPQDLFPEFLTDSGNGFAAASLSPGFLLVSMGSIQSQTLDNRNATTQPGEPIHCGVVGGASKWLRLRTEANATCQIDTLGSAIDTVLAVYEPTNLLNLAAGVVACDNNGAPDGRRSLLRFNSRAGTEYLVVVDGVNGDQGLISINWRLGLAPILLPASTPPPVRLGQSLTLRVNVTNQFGASYQWRWNGQNLSGATNQTLVLSNVTLANAGAYLVIVSNFAGIATGTYAVQVAVPYLRAEPQGYGESVRLWLPPLTNQSVMVERCADLTQLDWVPVYLHPGPTPAPYLDWPLTNAQPQFFRARPWP